MELESRSWLAFVGMVVAIAGILTMARINDHEIAKVNKKAQEAENKTAAAMVELNQCWIGFRKRLEEVILLRCSDIEEGKHDH
jgi:hypothetical protein